MSNRRLILWIAVLVGALATLDVWGYCTMTAARQRAIRANQDAETCNQLAARILTLESKPAIAAGKEQAQQELSRRIELAARSIGIAGDNLASIEPDPAIRIADTAYLEKPTTVQLREITLSQLAGLLCELSGDGTGLRIKSLRLTCPPQKQDGDLWSAEFTVIYLIYAPLPAQHSVLEKS
jgi:hypothetical protein